MEILLISMCLAPCDTFRKILYSSPSTPTTFIPGVCGAKQTHQTETLDYLPLSHKHLIHRRNSTIFSTAAVNSQANITYSCDVVILYDLSYVDGGTRPRFYDCEHLKPTYQPSEFFLVFRKPANEDVKTQLIVDAFNPL